MLNNKTHKTHQSLVIQLELAITDSSFQSDVTVSDSEHS